MVDVSKLSSAELLQAFKKKKAEEAEALAQKAVEIREKVDKYVQKTYGYTLAQIFTARRGDKPSKKSDVEPGKYLNAETGKVFHYKGPDKGRVPKWLREMDPALRKNSKRD